MSNSISQVYFFSYAKHEAATSGLSRLLSQAAFKGIIPKGKNVAVKLHLGEPGNIRYIRPVLVRKVVDTIKASGGLPFLFETVGSYPGERSTKKKYLSAAAMNGFVEEGVGAPVIIGDDRDELETLPINRPIDGCHLKEIRVPALLMKSARIIVLSHVKGHELAGLGGAIKNMGMGCVSTQTKRDEHSVNSPIIDDTKECDACSRCIDGCPQDAIELVNGKAEKSMTVECISCGVCVYRCKPHCWTWPPRAKEKLQVCLGHAAGTFVSAYKGKMIFVNFIQDVVPECDCAAASGLPVVQDVGIAVSLDPVAVDKASLDLIDSAPRIEGATSAKPPDLLGKMHDTDSLIQLRTAKKLGIGTLTYKLNPI